MKNRKMPPPANHLPGGNGVDIEHFKQEAPRAEEALRSGSTIVHELMITGVRTHHDGGPAGTGGISPDFLMRLQAFILSEVEAGNVKAERNDETATGKNSDQYSVTLGPI